MLRPALLAVFLVGAASAQPAEVPLRRGDLRWTLALTEPNTPGVARVGAAAPARDGGVCVVDEETLGEARSGPAVARYGADGRAARDGRPVLPWASPYVVLHLDVAAVENDCVASAILFDEAQETVTVEIARVGRGGVVWRRAVERPEGPSPDRVTVRADGSGSVWVGLGSPFPIGPALLVRLDAEGAEAARVVREPSGTLEVGGVRALDVLPDGRAVALADAEVLVAGGTEVVAHALPAGLTPTALALDTTAVPTAFVLGTTAAGDAAVSRVDLDSRGVVWTTTLGPTSTPPAFASPHTVAAREGEAFVTWADGDGVRVARLRGTDGVVLWETPIPTVGSAVPPNGLVADAEGVVAWVPSLLGRRAALSPEGNVRWDETERLYTIGPARVLVPCADGGTCLFANAGRGVSLVARQADGSRAWAAGRGGQPAPQYALDGVVPTPDGGAYLSGETRTPERGRDLFVARATPDGALAWSVAVDGGGLFYDGATTEFVNGLLVGTPDGGVVAAAGASAALSPERPLVVRLRLDGTTAWVQAPYVSGGGARAVALAGDGRGGAAVASLLNVNNVRGAGAALTYVDDSGDVVWTTTIADPARTDAAPTYPWAVHAVPDGFAVVLQVFEAETALRVDRFGFDGEALGSVRIDDVGGCTSFFGRPSSGAASSGTVLVATSPTNGPLSCARPAVLRVGPSGIEGSTFLGDVQDDVRALDVRADGSAAVAYGGDDGDRLARVDAGGGVTWDVAAGGTGVRLQAVAAGPDATAFAAGAAPSADGPGFAPLAVSYGPVAGLEPVALPRLGGLSTQATRVSLAEGGVGYVVLDAGAFETDAAGLARVDGAVSVDAAPRPAPAAPDFQVIGPNPVRAGGALRLRLGEAADLTLFDALGRRIASWPSTRAGDVEVIVPTAAAGLYVLRAAQDGAVMGVQIAIR